LKVGGDNLHPEPRDITKEIAKSPSYRFISLQRKFLDIVSDAHKDDDQNPGIYVSCIEPFSYSCLGLRKMEERLNAG
jgi:hypothetical protein